MEVALVIITGILAIIYFASKRQQKRTEFEKGNADTNRQPAHFLSQISSLQFPDRTDAIAWHLNAINKGVSTGDHALANLSYAKLIESIRQQSINDDGKYETILASVRAEYEQFRQVYSMEYPAQFLPKAERQWLSATTPKRGIFESVNVTSRNVGKNTTEFTVDIHTEALLARAMQINVQSEKKEKSICKRP